MKTTRKAQLFLINWVNPEKEVFILRLSKRTIHQRNAHLPTSACFASPTVAVAELPRLANSGGIADAKGPEWRLEPSF